MCGRPPDHRDQYLSGQNRHTIPEFTHSRRGSALLRRRSVCTHAHRALLVRLDLVPIYPVDCAQSGHRVCNNGDLLRLSGSIQLPG